MLFRQEDGKFKTAEGTITGEMVGTDLILTDTVNGGRLTLNKDFQEGEFGIHFWTPRTPPSHQPPHCRHRELSVAGGYIYTDNGVPCDNVAPKDVNSAGGRV